MNVIISMHIILHRPAQPQHGDRKNTRPNGSDDRVPKRRRLIAHRGTMSPACLLRFVIMLLLTTRVPHFERASTLFGPQPTIPSVTRHLPSALASPATSPAPATRPSISTRSPCKTHHLHHLVHGVSQSVAPAILTVLDERLETLDTAKHPQ